jgi:hypothetical protein
MTGSPNSCAGTATGQTAAPSPTMNSRRLIMRQPGREGSRGQIQQDLAHGPFRYGCYCGRTSI